MGLFLDRYKNKMFQSFSLDRNLATSWVLVQSNGIKNVEAELLWKYGGKIDTYNATPVERK